jgi:hypothetical protein
MNEILQLKTKLSTKALHETHRELRVWCGNDTLRVLVYMTKCLQLGVEFTLRDDRGGSGHWWLVFEATTIATLRAVFGGDNPDFQIDPTYVS